MVEQIRKYLLSKQCILFVSLHINQLINVVATYLDKEDSPHNRLETEDMATKYVTKLIPLDNRVIMPKTYDFAINDCKYIKHMKIQMLLLHTIL